MDLARAREEERMTDDARLRASARHIAEEEEAEEVRSSACQREFEDEEEQMSDATAQRDHDREFRTDTELYMLPCVRGIMGAGKPTCWIKVTAAVWNDVWHDLRLP